MNETLYYILLGLGAIGCFAFVIALAFPIAAFLNGGKHKTVTTVITGEEEEEDE